MTKDKRLPQMKEKVDVKDDFPEGYNSLSFIHELKREILQCTL